jgi:hypothetical protein
VTAAEWLARAHAVTDGATPGPWEYYETPGPWEYYDLTGHITDRERGLSIAPVGDLRGDSRTRIEDVRFAAHARTMLPAAVAAIEAVLHIDPAETSDAWDKGYNTAVRMVRAAITAALDGESRG